MAWLTLLLFSYCASAAPQAPLPEHQIKALYLLNFGRYIEWPATPPTAPQTFTIGIANAPEILQDLSEITRGKLIQNRKIKVIPILHASDAAPCSLVFIGAESPPSLLESLAGGPTLLVGSQDDFLTRGGVINFIKVANTIHMEINLDNARHAGLTISAKLLSLAKVTNTKPGRTP